MKNTKKLMDAITTQPRGRSFFVTKLIRPGTYKLMTKDRTEVRNTWHISQLRRFYA
jgi:hypothetical protein